MGGRIYYVEYWVNGHVVKDIPRGSDLLIKVVFNVDKEDKYRVCIQRQPGGQKVCMNWMDLRPLPEPQAWVAVFEEPKVTESPGGYKLWVWLEEQNIGVVDERWFPFHVVAAGGESGTPTTHPSGSHPGTVPHVPMKDVAIVVGAIGAGLAIALLAGRRR